MAFGSRFAAFVDDRSGVYAVQLALALMPMMAITGLAIDISKGQMASASLQSAVDAAAVAGTAAFQSADREQVVRAVFDSQVDDSGISLSAFRAQFDDSVGTIEVTASGSVTTVINSLFGVNEIEVTADAIGAYGVGKAQMDLVMCVDATGSMWNTIDAAKNSAMTLESELLAQLEQRSILIESLRARVIFFRDFDPPDLPQPIIEHDFLDLPERREDFRAIFATQGASGGGNWPEAGLECLHEAMTSQWAEPANNYTIVLPVIAIWTDAPSDQLGNTRNTTQGGAFYPSDAPSTSQGLLQQWNNVDVVPQEFRTIALFGPMSGGWNSIRAFPGFIEGGSVTDGNTDFVGTLADAIADNIKELPARLVY